jgi:hypothetical protein
MQPVDGVAVAPVAEPLGRWRLTGEVCRHRGGERSMRWRSVALSAGSIALAVLVWEFSADTLDRIGLEDFDPLDRIGLVFVVLSVAEYAAATSTRH